MRAINISRAERQIDQFPQHPSLWFKFSGNSTNIIQENIAATRSIVETFNGRFVTQSENEDNSELIWSDRKQLFWSQQVKVSY